MALRLKPWTVEKYREVLCTHWLPELGSLPSSEITREHVKTILQHKLMVGMKANVARSMFGSLRTRFHGALNDVTGHNPRATSIRSGLRVVRG